MRTKPFEIFYLGIKNFLPPLHIGMGRRLKRFAKNQAEPPEILDVGGRKSHYTIGVPANITLSDIPRETDVQSSLNLGINDEMMEQVRSRRSNIREVVYDDMTRSSFPDRSFDCVVAVEVLEHVKEDARFVSEVRRVLKPAGMFLMSTPNGDSVRDIDPDTERHYEREELRTLLEEHFDEVAVDYAIRSVLWHTLGLRSWSIKHPLRTFLSMVANVVNAVESSSEGVKNQSVGTCHLVAVARTVQRL